MHSEQPGTMQSALSKPLVGHDALRPEDAAERLLLVLKDLKQKGQTQFVDDQGPNISWLNECVPCHLGVVRIR